MGPSTDRETVVFERIGTNFKLSNIQAAVAVVQMGHIDGLLARRRALAARYVEQLTGRPGVSIPSTTAGGRHSYQSFCIHVPERDRLLRTLRSDGIEVQIGTYALHQHPAYRDGTAVEVRGSVDGSTYAFDHCLTLPLYHDLTFEQQDEVVAALCGQLLETAR
jgi:dTDP-4-amino-4,6-dideoxygalactose transaminase